MKLKDSFRFLTKRRNAYIAALITPAGDVVLKDLAKFCRANRTTFTDNDRITALLEGRREVWLRIAHHLNLDEDALWKLYGEGDKTE